MANIEERVDLLIKKRIESLGYELYDVLYVKEGQNYFLRVFIEKNNGEIDLADCEKVSNGINDILDEADYIKEQYFLEVSSTGVEKVLRKDKHLKAHLGEKVEIKLFKPLQLSLQNDGDKKQKKNKSNDAKELIGILKEFNQDQITLQTEDERLINIDRKDISHIKTIFDWEKI